MNIHLLIIILVCYLFTYVCVVNNRKNYEKINKMTNIMELFNANLNDTTDKSTINNFVALVNGKDIQLSNLNVTGNVNVVGKLNVTNGSSFMGGKHYFQDEEMAGRLRIGVACNSPGIYADDNKDIILSSSSGNINIINSIAITNKLFANNVEIPK